MRNIGMLALAAVLALTATQARAWDTVVQVDIQPVTITADQARYGPVLDNIYYQWERQYVSRMDSLAMQAENYRAQAAFACTGNERAWAQRQQSETNQRMRQETAIFQQAVVQRYGFVPAPYHPVVNTAALGPGHPAWRNCGQGYSHSNGNDLGLDDLVMLFQVLDTPDKPLHKNHVVHHDNGLHKGHAKPHHKPGKGHGQKHHPGPPCAYKGRP